MLSAILVCLIISSNLFIVYRRIDGMLTFGDKVMSNSFFYFLYIAYHTFFNRFECDAIC